MHDHVCWMLNLEVEAGKLDDLRALMAEMAAATETNEPGTLDYEWSLNDEGTHCHLFERYADSAAAMVHIGTFGSRFAERFFAAVKPVSFTLYGRPDATVREALASSVTCRMLPAAGFSR